MRACPSSLGAPRAALLLLAAGALGCDGPTQLLVVVDTDLEPGAEISAVEVSVGGAAGLGRTHRFELSEVSLPFSFGVSRGGDADEAVRVEARGLDPSGVPFVQRAVSTRFARGRILRVELPLARACAHFEEDCGDGAPCDEGPCASMDIDPAALEDATPDETLEPLFDGPRERPDAGVTDAGACDEGAACDASDPCRPGQLECGAEGPTCAPGAPRPEGTDCGEGRACDAMGRCR